MSQWDESNLVSRARDFARWAHESVEQRRKYTDEPYHYHCERVADWVRGAGGSPTMIAAAWLHDVAEDTPVTLDVIRALFGLKVALYVEALTSTPPRPDLNRGLRKAMDRLRLYRAPPEVKTIKLADIIDNCADIREQDPDFAQVYIPEKRLMLEVLKDGNAALWERAHRILHPEEDL